MYILGMIKNGSFQLEYVYRLEIANLFCQKKIKNLNKLFIYRKKITVHSDHLQLHYKGRFPLKSFLTSLNTYIPIQSFCLWFHDLSVLQPNSNLSSAVNIWKKKKKNTGKCTLCSTIIATIQQSWGCKWLHRRGIKNSISRKAVDGKIPLW